MSWTQHHSGYWSRPLDCHDRIFQFIADSGRHFSREHWVMLGSVQLDYPPDTDITSQLRTAWKALRLQQPDIAAELHAHEKRYYPVHDSDTLDQWCDATFTVEPTLSSPDELLKTLRLGPPLTTCHWIKASNHLCLIGSHWRWDGRGLVMVLDQLLTHLANPPILNLDGSEAHRLIPSLDTVIGMPTTRNPSWDARANDLITTYTTGQPSIGLLPNSKTCHLPGNTHRVHLRLPATKTLALRSACRAHGITLTTALHAAVASVTARANHAFSSCPPPGTGADTGTDTRYISWQAFDLRRYCPAPYNGAIHAAAVRMVALPINVDASAPWTDLVGAIHPLYSQNWAPPGNGDENEMMLFRVPYVEKVTEIMKTHAQAQAQAQPSEPVLSNLGLLDGHVRERYGAVRVVDVGVLVSVLTPQVTLHCWAWRGELCLSACYNEAYYSPGDVSGFLGAVGDTLELNLLV